MCVRPDPDPGQDPQLMALERHMNKLEERFGSDDGDIQVFIDGLGSGVVAETLHEQLGEELRKKWAERYLEGARHE